jgi:hypothetical protein
MPSERGDRLLYWPLVFAVSCPLTCILGWTYLFAGSIFLVPLACLVWVGASIAAAVLCVIWFIERAWLRLLSAAILPVTALVAAINLHFVWEAGRRAGEYAHFFALYPRYLAEIRLLPADESRFKVWEWVDYGPCATGLAYDENDVVGRHPGTRTGPFDNWRVSSQVSGVPVYNSATALRHFYFVYICPISD